METRRRRNVRDLLGSSAGWLFADLLLALAMLFLAANTIMPKHPVTPTPPPIVTKPPTPKPTPPLQGLERKVYEIRNFIIDPDKLLSDDPNTKKDIFARLKAYPFFKHRKAGLLIVYGGAPSVSDVHTAETIATKIYNLIQNLGRGDETFKNVAFYDPLYVLGGDANAVAIDAFLLQ